MSIEFRKFTSLENTYQQPVIDKIIAQGKDGGVWIATEKLDGAHFTFAYDGKHVHTGSRVQWVDGSFFNCQEVIDRYSSCVVDMWNKIAEDIKDKDFTLYIDGELTGPKINGRVMYEKDFFAYDYYIITSCGVVMRAERDKLVQFRNLVDTGFRVPELVACGTFDECMDAPNLFRSHHTPHDYEGENWCEGIVIEPNQPSWLANGSRIYLKSKNVKFAEVGGTKGKQREERTIPAPVAALYDLIAPYATVNRVHAVRSKSGVDDFKALLSATIADALEEYEKETGVKWNEGGGDVKGAMKLFTADVSKCVRTVLFPTKEA